ncbi:choice-of-anchor D domain-containing protein [Dactylosporangium sp. NPDC005572]|uniref:choice-of-anchor D domain-containing protein n=1 Tax=Dactylosporangium sp. NPDC005572 TaxID=3156889 RepID=UPI0033BDC6F9
MTVVLALVAAALPGVAFAAPTAPYDAFILNGRHSVAITPDNGTITLTHWPSGGPGTGREAVQIEVETTDQNPSTRRYYSMWIFAPYDQQIVAGTFPVSRISPEYELRVDGDGGCLAGDGTLIIRSISRDANNWITSLSFWHKEGDASCTQGAGGPQWGEVRWHAPDGYVEAVQSDAMVDFGDVDLGMGPQPHAASRTVTFTGAGTSPLQLGAASVEGTGASAFAIKGNTCTQSAIGYGQTCSIGVVATPTAVGTYEAQVKIPDNSQNQYRIVKLKMTVHAGAEGTYRPVSPFRLLDTREGNGAPKAPLGGGRTLHLQVTGRGYVPLSTVSAVVLNVTVTGPTSAGYLTLYPTGVGRPTASSLNFPAGWTGANSVTVPVGANGQVDIFNAAGNVHIIADVMGYYLAYDDTHQSTAGQYWPTQPQRLLDSRDPAFGGPLRPFEYVKIPVSYGAEYNSHIRALAVNITAVTPTMGGFVTAWNGFDQRPNASTLNFTPGSVVPNLAVVPTAWCYECGGNGYPSIGVGNYSSGSTHIVVDIFGFYDDGQIPGGLRFHPLTPTRIVDTRDGLGAGTFTGAGTKTVTAPPSVAGDDTYALVANVTGVDPANSTYLSLWATGGTKPTVSNLNLTPHEVRPNAAFVPVGPGNKFNVFNAAWKVDVVIDVSGTFEFLPGSVPAAQAAGLAQQGPLRASSTGTPERQPLR